jgi:hypothetical protein
MWKRDVRATPLANGFYVSLKREDMPLVHRRSWVILVGEPLGEQVPRVRWPVIRHEIVGVRQSDDDLIVRNFEL